MDITFGQTDWVIGPWWRGLGGAVGVQVPEEVPAPQLTVKLDDKTGPQTHRQVIFASVPGVESAFGDGMVGGYALGPLDSNGMNPRQARAEATRSMLGTYYDYRRCRQDGIVAIGRAMADALIILNKWSYEPAEETDEGRALADRVKRMWERKGGLGDCHQGLSQREWLLSESCRAKDYGNHTMEVVYGDDDEDGSTIITQLLSCLPETTRPLVVLNTRQFAGVRNWGINGGSVDLAPDYCVRFIYDVEGGSLFGRSRFENCKDWISLKWEARDKIRTDMNIAIGNIMDVGYPVSDSGDPAETRTNEAKASTIAISLARGMTVTHPEFSMKSQIAMANAGIDPSKVHAWKINRLNTGANSFAGFKVAIDLIDEQILFGMLVLPSSVREAQHNARATAEQHTDTMGMMSWGWIAYVAGTAQLLTDKILKQWGKKPGSVRIAPDPLEDETKEILKEILEAILSGNPEIGPKILDLKRLVDKLKVPLLKDFDQAKLLQQMAAESGSDALSHAERLRGMGYDDAGIKKIRRERTEDDAVPTDEDELGNRSRYQTKKLSADEPGGHWVTMDGVHVLVGKDGAIESGPANLVGKKSISSKDLKLGDEIQHHHYGKNKETIVSSTGKLISREGRNIQVEVPVKKEDQWLHDGPTRTEKISLTGPGIIHVNRNSEIQPVYHNISQIRTLKPDAEPLPKKGYADGQSWTISEESGGNVVFQHKSGTEWGTRGQRLAQALGARYSRRKGGFVMSKSKAKKLVGYLESGHDASVLDYSIQKSTSAK